MSRHIVKPPIIPRGYRVLTTVYRIRRGIRLPLHSDFGTRLFASHKTARYPLHRRSTSCDRPHTCCSCRTARRWSRIQWNRISSLALDAKAIKSLCQCPGLRPRSLQGASNGPAPTCRPAGIRTTEISRSMGGTGGIGQKSALHLCPRGIHRVSSYHVQLPSESSSSQMPLYRK